MNPMTVIRFDPLAASEPWPDRPPGEVAAGSSKQAGQVWIDDAAHGLSAGLWEAAPSTSNWIDWPATEFIILIAGEVIIAEKGRTTTFRAGDCFVLPQGLRCVWKQYDTVRKFFITLRQAAPETGGGALCALKLHPKVTLAPARPPPPEVLAGPEPTQRSRNYITAARGQFNAGIRDSTAYAGRLLPAPRHELMHLIEGEATLTGAAGPAQTFRAGDTFFVPLGAPNAWRSTAHARKFYCSFEPKRQV